MDNTVIVALLSLVGTAIGSVAGIIAANKMAMYRIEQLEKKVAAHNSLVERMYKLEGRMNLLENKRRDSHEQD